MLRAGGILYLAWLGLGSLSRAFAGATRLVASEAGNDEGPWKNISDGFMTNALNPAIATFYLVLLPQFIPPESSIARTALLLTALHIGIAFSWHVAWAAAGGTLARTLASPRVRRTLEAITGFALLALAVRLALGGAK